MAYDSRLLPLPGIPDLILRKQRGFKSRFVHFLLFLTIGSPLPTDIEAARGGSAVREFKLIVTRTTAVDYLPSGFYYDGYGSVLQTRMPPDLTTNRISTTNNCSSVQIDRHQNSILLCIKGKFQFSLLSDCTTTSTAIPPSPPFHFIHSSVVWTGFSRLTTQCIWS